MKRCTVEHLNFTR